MKIPGGLFDNGLPIGILMFLGTAWAVLRKKLGRKKAAQRFPDLAARLGLAFTPPRYAGNVGVLSGSYKGREVRIDPDDQRLIKLRFTGTPRVDLRTYENSLRPPFDMVTVHSGDRNFDRFFKTRFATEDVAATIAATREPGSCLEPFMGRYSRHVQSVTVTSEGVVCRLDFIPEDGLGDLLAACAALAELLEPGGLPAQAPPARPSDSFSDADLDDEDEDRPQPAETH